ncbi:DUF1989 domain-containing protein [Acetobacter sp.]|uniref:DUF1989 domain-containing protein n=1 Tax=Acetobacter sp. TaxID=440 RepID=UPI0025B857C4|nr:DUF1989 domain-containing protein [Acetobacter sp.]MCH4092043.1 aminomethyltransferase family protein [Acetobacter sp.]MCI1300702.1 aminomethyltransferase family protein [Acetobacter sp.]MCI1317637.1 aminomethyltransferase family protein [Acetobacter sp.]
MTAFLVKAPQRSSHRINGGDSARKFPVAAGERFEVLGVDGGQTAVVFAPQGMLKCSSGEETAPAFSSEALSRFLDGEEISFVILDAEAVPGESVSFTVLRDGDIVVEVPADDMLPENSDAPGRVDVAIYAASATSRLPAPLGPVLQEIHVPAASAVSYRVREGDYIQIIDVDGRQCSDFLAFDALALEEGRTFGLDATATRTVQGSAMPTPGLHAKFLNEHMQPMVEIVQDTVGRHDAFLLACTAKYYDDSGYPGHDNCTENFNRVLEVEGIVPRSGWPAINFFFNTQVLECGTIVGEEPWSRPGDYVLLRAERNLVCASSSCADDVTSANGWTPTDIHIRIYDRSNRFPKGVTHRMTPESPPVMTRQSGFHDRLEALGAKFVEYKGFWLPSCFEGYGPVSEYWACRTKVCVMDLSALRKFEITGPDAELLLQIAVTRDIRKLAVGQVVYTALCYPHGGMLDDATVFRLAPQAFRLVCGDDYCGEWLCNLADDRGLNARIRASTDQLHNLSVQGPESREILASLIWTCPTQPDIVSLKWFRFTIGRIGGPEGIPVVVSRTGYTGELGYEIWCHPRQAFAVWDAIWKAGKPKGMMPLGLEALDWLRIEAGLAFASYEFCPETDPFEAGLGFAVPAAKTEDYVGREALGRRRENPRQCLVGLESHMNDRLDHGDPVYSGRARVGVVTSSCSSPVLGKNIALARVDVSVTEIGKELEIGKLDGFQKRIPVKVTSFPAYDPKKTRVRS